MAEVVNINKANEAALQHYLKGIGVKKAKSIVAYRAEYKKFTSIEEIMEVKGIGKGIFKKIKDNLSLHEGVVSVFKSTHTIEKKAKVKAEAVKVKAEAVKIKAETVKVKAETVKVESQPIVPKES